MENSRETDKKVILKKSFIITFILGFIAYGYVFVNYTPSHDGLMIIKTNQWWEMSLGRFVVMYYAPLRGMIESPWLIGMLSMAYTALAVFLTVDMFGFGSDTWKTFMVSAVYVLNITYISNACVYIFCWDLLALAMLTSVFAAYLMVRSDKLWAYALAVLMSALVMGMYQSYITVTVGLYLIAVCKQVMDDEKIGAILRRFGFFCAAMLASGGVYLVLVKVFQAVSNVEPYEGAYESLSSLKNLSIPGIIKTVPLCYKQVISYFITRTTYDTMMNRCFNLALFVIGAVLWGYLIFRYVHHDRQYIRAVLIIACAVLFPLGVNAVSLLLGGQIYHMMMYSFQLVYLFALFPALYSIDELTVRGRSMRLMLPVTILTALLSFCVIRYANDIFYYQKLVGEGAEAAITNIVYDIERDEEFDKASTPIVVIGDIGDAIGEDYEYRWTYSNTGGLTSKGTTITYNNCFEWYTRYVLGKNYKYVNDPDVYEMISGSDEADDMPSYPHAGYSKMIDGYMVVKFE